MWYHLIFFLQRFVAFFSLGTCDVGIFVVVVFYFLLLDLNWVEKSSHNVASSFFRGCLCIRHVHIPISTSFMYISQIKSCKEFFSDTHVKMCTTYV